MTQVATCYKQYHKSPNLESPNKIEDVGGGAVGEWHRLDVCTLSKRRGSMLTWAQEQIITTRL